MYKYLDQDISKARWNLFYFAKWKIGNVDHMHLVSVLEWIYMYTLYHK